MQIALIEESQCIGCTKCIQVCPFDAIIGAPQQLHTILVSECTGCGLCVAPCPVDCIQMLPLTETTFDPKRAAQRRRARRERLKRHGVTDQKMELTRETFAAIPTTTLATAEITQALAQIKRK